jgi:hypothetical protein
LLNAQTKMDGKLETQQEAEPRFREKEMKQVMNG